MGQISLLDCTLRDGGYVNDWNFGQSNLVSVCNRLISAGIEYVEVGFLDQRRAFDINRSIAPDTKSFRKIYDTIDRKNSKIIGMIDYGTCDISHIEPCEKSFLDGVRVIFKKHVKEEALEFCKQIKSLGYVTFAQLVSITSYEESDLLELVDIVNSVRPDVISIVDTYGLLFKEKLFYYYEILNRRLNQNISLAFHSHNNFQLGYANGIELAHEHFKNNNQRNLILDGTLFGMGKGAGNAPIELLAMSLNKLYNKNYNISQLLEAIDVNILDFNRINPWGYSVKFFIAASNDCHPNYVSYLLEKKTLSVMAINQILQRIEGEAKLLYDKSYIERLYIEYQRNSYNDFNVYEELEEKLKDKKILAIGPGPSIEQEYEVIQRFINEKHPEIISINFIPERYNTDYVFFTNSRRYAQQEIAIGKAGSKIHTIATSNVTKSDGSFDYYLDYESLIDRDAPFMDNSFLMLMRMLKRINIQEVFLAGFDGYSSNNASNYYLSRMEYDSAKRRGNEINENVNKVLSKLKKDIIPHFITKTIYSF